MELAAQTGGGVRSRPAVAMAVGLPVLAAIVVAGFVYVIGPRGGISYDGPLSDRPVSGWSRVGASLDVGTSATLGIDIPYHTWPVRPILERVLLIAPSPGLSVAGYFVTPCPIGAFAGFPPDRCRRLHALQGFVVRAGISEANRTIIAVGLTRKRAGEYGFAGVVLEYRVGQTPYRAIYLQAGVICSSFGADCPTPGLDATQNRLSALLDTHRHDEIYRMAREILPA